MLIDDEFDKHGDPELEPDYMQGIKRIAKKRYCLFPHRRSWHEKSVEDFPTFHRLRFNLRSKYHKMQLLHYILKNRGELHLRKKQN